GVHNAPTDEVVALLLQPSLSPRDHDAAPRRRTSAFVLQAFPQPRVMIRLCSRLMSREKNYPVIGVCRNGKIALPYVHSDYALMRIWRRITKVDLQAHQQIELLVWLVVPEFGRADLRPVREKGHMSGIAGIGRNHAPLQCQKAHSPLSFQAIV